MKKGFYFIDGENAVYCSLFEVRNHVWMQSEKDKADYNGMYVKHTTAEHFSRIIVIRKDGNVILAKA